MQDFRKLKVWEKAHALALAVYEATSVFPTREQFGLTSQIRRAVGSIPANIAEGCGRAGDRELSRFAQIATGSASELEYHLLLARDLGFLSPEIYDGLVEGLLEVKRMLAALIVRLRTVARSPPGPGGLSTEEQAQMAAYFRGGLPPATTEEMADYYQKLDMFGVIFAIDAETATGRPPVPNDYIAETVRRWPDTFTGFGTVDPWKGKMALREANRVKDLGLKGLKFHPSTQEFYPNDRRFYPLWEKAQALGLIVLFHSGTTGVGAGRPGGGGVKLGYARPIPYMDDVAADFPELTIVMAHPAFPWQDEQLAMLVHKPNVYMDLSGWSPKYFSPLLVTYANYLITDKVMFGSDYPAITPERWLRDFDEMGGFREEIRAKLLRENAARLLGIDP